MRRSSPFLRFALVLVLPLLVSRCTGWENAIEGVVKLSESVFFKSEDGRSVPVAEGPATLEFENGIYGIYSPSATLTDSRGHRVQLTLPRADFAELNFEASPQELGQPYGIRATRQQTILSREPFVKVESCIYCGYCRIDEVVVKSDGTTERNWGYQNSCRCPGAEAVTKERRQISESLTVEFIRARGSKAAGTFTSTSPLVYTDESTVLSRSECSDTQSFGPTVRFSPK